ncbi:MAG: hypothetical protein HY057_15150, partial [Rhodospirillales bacterium]|nr:hypothetical protein [Rhodospirillales bacterium]
IDRIFGHGLNPSFPDYIGSKVGFDCCRPFPFRYEHDRAFYKKMSLAGLDLAAPEIGKPAPAKAKPAKAGKPGKKPRKLRNLAGGGQAM